MGNPCWIFTLRKTSVIENPRDFWVDDHTCQIRLTRLINQCDTIIYEAPIIDEVTPHPVNTSLIFEDISLVSKCNTNNARFLIYIWYNDVILYANFFFLPAKMHLYKPVIDICINPSIRQHLQCTFL